MTLYDIEAGDIIYYFRVDRHYVAFLKLECTSRMQYTVLEVYSKGSGYNVGQRLGSSIRVGSLYRRFDSPLKKAAKYGIAPAVVESIFNDGSHKYISDYHYSDSLWDGSNRTYVTKGWQKHF